MRAMGRNKRQLWYAKYTGKTAVRDSNGLLTGEYELSYSDPVKLSLNYSAGISRIDLSAFGIREDYSRTIVTEDLNCPIDKMTRLWLGIDPADNPHNYVVVGKADSINSLMYALKEVEVTE